MRDHMQRLVNSGRIYRMENPFTLDQLCAAATKSCASNRMNSCYIRPECCADTAISA